MKTFLFLFGLIAAGIVGYSFEPDIFESITGKRPERKKIESVPAIVEPVPAIVPPTLPAIDPSKFPADRLPEKVLLKADAEIADPASNLKMTITAGNRVNLIRLDGQNIVISPGAGPFEGSVPISQTDLLEQLAAMPEPTMPELAANTPPPEPVIPAEPVAPEPAPAPEPEPTPAPEPEPAPEPVAAAPTGPVDVLAVMQASIKGGEIKEFSFDQVLDWEAADETETIDGSDYHTGIASYKAETVFGVKTIQAKALIKDGKVVRWLWPKSGMEIK